MFLQYFLNYFVNKFADFQTIETLKIKIKLYYLNSFESIIHILSGLIIFKAFLVNLKISKRVISLSST
jgi:hypothetical protein